jgi:hypothetical protein
VDDGREARGLHLRVGRPGLQRPHHRLTRAHAAQASGGGRPWRLGGGVVVAAGGGVGVGGGGPIPVAVGVVAQQPVKLVGALSRECSIRAAQEELHNGLCARIVWGGEGVGALAGWGVGGAGGLPGGLVAGNGAQDGQRVWAPDAQREEVLTRVLGVHLRDGSGGVSVEIGGGRKARA